VHSDAASDARSRAGPIAAARSLAATPAATAVWSMLGVRLLFWFLAVLGLLWSPVHANFPQWSAYGPHSDLVFGTFAQWDADWFLRVVKHGYDVVETSAFFPGYPLVVRGAAVVFRSAVVAGVLISLAAAGLAAVFLYRIGTDAIGKAGALDGVLFLALYPCALVFTAPYSDGLFLALVTGSFLAATRNRPWVAGVCAAAAVATRLAGLALIPSLILLLWPRNRSAREVIRPIPSLVLPLAALGGYMAYLHDRFGDSFAYVHVLEFHWYRQLERFGPFGGLWHSLRSGWQGAVELGRHLPGSAGSPQGFPSPDQLATWNLLNLLVLVGVLWLTWVAWRRLGPALGLYALSMDFLLLANTVAVVPLLSFPRYVLGNFPVFIALAATLQERPRARQAVLIAFAAVSAVAAVAFARKTWIA
jgi:Mannosyltransferase (PIG-V)